MDPLNTPTYLRLREQIRTDIVSGIWALGSHCRYYWRNEVLCIVSRSLGIGSR